MLSASGSNKNDGDASADQLSPGQLRTVNAEIGLKQLGKKFASEKTEKVQSSQEGQYPLVPLVTLLPHFLMYGKCESWGSPNTARSAGS